LTAGYFFGLLLYKVNKLLKQTFVVKCSSFIAFKSGNRKDRTLRNRGVKGFKTPARGEAAVVSSLKTFFL